MHTQGKVCNTVILVHLFSSVLRSYKEKMFIILYKLLMNNAISNSPPRLVKPPRLQTHCPYKFRKSVRFIVILTH